jgi:hypothetical protein
MFFNPYLSCWKGFNVRETVKRRETLFPPERPGERLVVKASAAHDEKRSFEVETHESEVDDTHIIEDKSQVTRDQVAPLSIYLPLG